MVKKEPVGVLNSVFSYGKLRESSLTYTPVLVVLCLETEANIDQIHETTFSLFKILIRAINAHLRFQTK